MAGIRSLAGSASVFSGLLWSGRVQRSLHQSVTALASRPAKLACFAGLLEASRQTGGRTFFDILAMAGECAIPWRLLPIQRRSYKKMSLYRDRVSRPENCRLSGNPSRMNCQEPRIGLHTNPPSLLAIFHLADIFNCLEESWVLR